MSKIILRIIIIREKFICCNTANYYIHSVFFRRREKETASIQSQTEYIYIVHCSFAKRKRI
jgi:hypothetical protein